MTYLVDSHCHLASLSLEGKAANNIDEIIERARRCGVSHFLSIACTSKEFEKNLDLAGIHIDSLVFRFSTDDHGRCLIIPTTVGVTHLGTGRDNVNDDDNED